MKIPCRKYLFQLHPWPFMCTQMIISSWENSEENVIFLPCFSTEFARFYLTGNKQKIARRTVYFSTSVRPVMFRLWHDHCTSPTFSRKLHLFFIGLIKFQMTPYHVEKLGISVPCNKLGTDSHRKCWEYLVGAKCGSLFTSKKSI